MKITKRQLRRIVKEERQKFLKEMHPRSAADDAYVADLERREELADQIVAAEKDVFGRKHVHDLEGKTIEELEDILHDLDNSDVVRSLQKMDRDDMEDQMGRDQELSRAETAPRSQGMGRRPGGSKSQRRMESKMKITKNQLRRIIKEEKQKLLAESRIRNAVRKALNEEAINPAGVTAEFDNESVMLNGRPYDQEELASEVSNEEDWQDNFSIMGMYAAQALRDNYGVTTFTDYEQPGKSWSANEFIRHLRSIA